MDNAFDIAMGVATIAYIIGIPIASGVGVALGMGPAAILLSPLWPAIGLAWLGFWVAA